MIDLERVGNILREAAETAIAPRFDLLDDGDVREKAPGEVVTVADSEAERLITGRLHDLLPGIPVVGEEAVSENPALMDAIATEPVVWLVDPLDGTSNFAQGDPRWAVMAALVRNGETVAAAIYRHTDRRLYLAESGAGASCNGKRLISPKGETTPESLSGAILTRFLTDGERANILPQLSRFRHATNGFMCAGYEYPAVAEGEEDFALFQRTLPWDHAPGTLILREAGGRAAHPDGTAYRPDTNRRGLLLATSPEIWTVVRDLLYPHLT